MTTQLRSIGPPTSTTPTAGGPTRRRVGWFVAAAAVVVLGLLTALGWAVVGVVAAWQAPDGFARTELPGTVAVQVTDTGTQWLYYEHTDGTDVASLDGIGIRIVGPDGQAVSSQKTELAMVYDAKDGALGTAIGTFDATTRGTYTVTAQVAPTPGTALAVGPSVADPLLTPLLGAAAVVGLSMLLAAGLLIAGRRRR
jgi:hypothetical protein